MKKNNNKFIYSSFIYIIGNFLAQGINFITLPIFIRILTVEEFGIVSLFTTLSSIFSVLISCQINNTIGSAKIEFNSKEYQKYLNNIILIPIINFIFFILIIFLLDKKVINIFGVNKKIFLLVLIYGFLTSIVNFFSFRLKFEYENIKQLFISLIIIFFNISISIISILNMNESKFYGRILGYIISNLLIVIYYFFLNFKKIRINYNHLKFAYSLGIPLIFNALSHLFLVNIDKIMISKMLGNVDLGIYSFSYTLGMTINMLIVLLNNLWQPWYFENMKVENKELINSKKQIYIKYFTYICLIILLVSSEVIEIIAPKTYIAKNNIFPLVVGGYYFVFLYGFCSNYQLYKKNTRFLAFTSIISALINIILNFILIKKYGIIGASISTFVSYIILFYINYIVIKIKYKINVIFRKILISNIALILLGIGSYYFNLYYRYVLLSFILIYLLKNKNKIKKEILN